MTKGRNDILACIFIGCFIFSYIFFFSRSSCSLSLEKGETYEKPSLFMIQHFQKQAIRRRQFMDLVKNSTNHLGWGYLYNNLAPEVYCPEKIKVGTTDDGGKWMCSPENLPNNCVIFALGISGKITYEEDLQTITNRRCRIISVDSNRQKEKVIRAIERINGIVVEAFISTNNTIKSKTMSAILEEHNINDLEILKIDIEGKELTTMQPFLEKYTPAQILIEVHGNPRETLKLLRIFSSKKYFLYHFEINGRHHTACEYSFIHESRLERYGATLLARYL